MNKEDLINLVSDEVRLLLNPFTKDAPQTESKLADKKDLVWKNNLWSIPYVNQTDYGQDEEGELYSISFPRTWKSLREASVWLKRNKGIIYTSFNVRLVGAVKSVRIDGVIADE